MCRPGDLWVLGRHRILCGDSGAREAVEQLLGAFDQKPTLLATDPPYAVEYDGSGHAHLWGSSDKDWEDEWDKGMDGTDALQLYLNFLKHALEFCAEHLPIYQWHAWKRSDVTWRAWEELGLLLHQQIIWVKSKPVLTRSHFMWSHEPCLYGWPQGSMPAKNRRPPNNETTCWMIDAPGVRDHPTQKPLELFERPIKYHTMEGEVVYEPFSGSGSQLMAAEKLNRCCAAMEIDPKYVDSTILRWQKATGEMARRYEDNEFYDNLRDNEERAAD